MPQKVYASKDWYREQIQQYLNVQPRYKQMACCLQVVLQDAADSLGLQAIVQARAKTIASFAEKIQRPGKHYKEPLQELTDLCGARVIAHTLRDVAALSRFVESNFMIFYEHSGKQTNYR